MLEKKSFDRRKTKNWGRNDSDYIWVLLCFEFNIPENIADSDAVTGPPETEFIF